MKQLMLCLSIMTLLIAAQRASASNEEIPGSNYSPASGESFFLLADSSFASDELARVRLEAPGRNYQRLNLEAYGGVDIRVYSIPEPLAFLQNQKNLHRIKAEGNFRGEGLANTLAFLWDNWYKKARRVMQRAFSFEARQQATAAAPSLKMGTTIARPTTFDPQPQFEPLPGLPMVSQFRYPIWDAKPIQPPEGVKLAGSSSNFIRPAEGNVYIPLGKLEPGLYLVEAMAGKFRATTVVFVSDTVAITKITSNELLVWTVNKQDGGISPDTQLLWTDGLGTLQEGFTGKDGILRLEHASPERSYVIGKDNKGGVFVSENFYYHSEIYNAKLYAFTDRPLYRPGDWVELKILGREFTNARDSVPVAGAIDLTVLDATGSAMHGIKLELHPEAGAAGRFQLPETAVAGGYELRFQYGGDIYSATFRVAEYIKPHFEISLQMEKTEYHTGETLTGTLNLAYPDGKPVANAHIEVSLRSQQLAMVGNELQYLGQFPVKLQTASLVTDSDGKASLTLPSADKPSRYLLTAFASDGAAYRVKTHREILIERGITEYSLTSARHFSGMGEPINFDFSAQGTNNGKNLSLPETWEWVRLEDQSKESGNINADAHKFSLTFSKPGNYNIAIKDKHGLLVGATNHVVSGKESNTGTRTDAGSIQIVFDRDNYTEGQTAQALITFPEPIKEALLTLERDRVEATGLLSAPPAWIELEKLNPTQYRASIDVTENFSPNITLSVAYVAQGQYTFQNAGLKVKTPGIDIGITTDKTVYAPGETVTVELDTRLDGQPLPAHVTVSVVDEMIYALQPEIAPSIDDFFYHPRRNNVRTSSSLSFITYDVALPGIPKLSLPSGTHNRSVKVLERPRREEVDTAAWQPDLVTGESGKIRFTFRMPDSLTRWRITARSMDTNGHVGQKTAYLRSEKPVYLKWAGPQRFRTGDQPALGLFAFNQANENKDFLLKTRMSNDKKEQAVTLAPGANYLPLPEFKNGLGMLEASIESSGKPLDSLQVDLQSIRTDWQTMHSRIILVDKASTALDLPASAHDIVLQPLENAEVLFLSVANDLLEYPWGCVEQTSSRLLPMALAFPHINDKTALPGQPDYAMRSRDKLRQIISTNRLRLIQMAGPDAHFSWWGEIGNPDAFLTTYAYYADWHASQSLGLSLPEEHWQHVLGLYSQQADSINPLQRALMLDMMHTMHIPVQSLLEGLKNILLYQETPKGLDINNPHYSVLMAGNASPVEHAMAIVITARLAEAAHLNMGEQFMAMTADAIQQLELSSLPFAKAVLLYKQPVDASQAMALLQQLAPEYPTMERAITLAWLQNNFQQWAIPGSFKPGKEWEVDDSGLVRQWKWKGNSIPATLELPEHQSEPLAVRLQWKKTDPEQEAPNFTLTRKLWRLVPGEKQLQFKAEEVDPGETLSSNTLYLDEVSIDTGYEPMRFGLLEVPLPAGAEIESTTWGVNVSGLDSTGAVELDRTQHQNGDLSYALPIERLQGKASFKHLVRFSQKGRFNVPPMRYQAMYQPDILIFEKPVLLESIEVE